LRLIYVGWPCQRETGPANAVRKATGGLSIDIKSLSDDLEGEALAYDI